MNPPSNGTGPQGAAHKAGQARRWPGLTWVEGGLLLAVLSALGVWGLGGGGRLGGWFGPPPAERQQDEAVRLTLQTLTHELALAGFWGGHVPSASPVAAPVADPCQPLPPHGGTPAEQQRWLAAPVASFEPAGWPSACRPVLGRVMPGSDVLVVRRAHGCPASQGPVAGLPCSEPPQPQALYLAVDDCPRRTTPRAPYLLAPQGHEAVLQRDCATPAPRHRVLNTVYFVREAEPGQAPALWRSELGVVDGRPAQLPPTPLAEGVQALRVEWHETPAAAAAAASALPAGRVRATPAQVNAQTAQAPAAPGVWHCTPQCPPQQLRRAASATVFLLVRSPAPLPGHRDTRTYTLGQATYGPFNDGYTRRVVVASLPLLTLASRTGGG